jgi:hypothetical protein
MHRLLLALVLLNSCAFSTECKTMGCRNTVSIVGAPSSAQACLDDECTALDNYGSPSGSVGRFADVHEGDAKHVLTVDSVRYEGPIRFEKVLPNGPNCSPRCYRATFVLADGKLKPQAI